MTRWDEIGTILALSIAIFGILPNISIIKNLVISLLRHFHAPGTRCTELLWEDVPEGVLHECPPHTPWHVCKHKIVHGRKARCWEQLFSVVFSRAWTDNGRQKRRVSKPEMLPLSEDFMRIDFRVLMAFMISTIGCNKSPGSLMWGLSTYTEKDEFVLDVGGAERVEMKAQDGKRSGEISPWPTSKMAQQGQPPEIMIVAPTGKKENLPWTCWLWNN